MSTDELLAERGKTHGDYSVHAACTQGLKVLFWKYVNERTDKTAQDFTDVERETLAMIFHKLGRIAAGDQHLADHWDDIAGYARLVAQRLP